MGKYIDELKASVKMGADVWIADTATVLGNVTLGEQASVWYGAVIRADMSDITIGDRSNIQDGVICHSDPGIPLSIGHDNVVGHGAILHGCTIGNHNLIGMRATIMNRAQIGNNCVIGAHALVTEGMKIPSNSMVLGSPARVVRQLTDDEIAKLKEGSLSYVQEAAQYLSA
jgi:carbonic anhydrase/acetyltransferase-like protein (isoleucine patch superfamily)